MYQWLSTPERKISHTKNTAQILATPNYGSETPTTKEDNQAIRPFDLTTFVYTDLKELATQPNQERTNLILDRLKLYLSTERDSSYRENLKNKLNPLRLALVRENRCTELVLQTTSEAIAILKAQKSGIILSLETTKELTQKNIDAVLSSYEAATSGRLDKKQQKAEKDRLTALKTDMKLCLISYAEDSSLAQQLTNKTVKELEAFKTKATEDNYKAATANENIDAFFAEHDAIVEEATTSIRESSAFKNSTMTPHAARECADSKIEIDSTLLETALQTKNQQVIQWVINYAKSTAILATLLRDMLDKYIDKDIEQQIFDDLVATGCFSDSKLNADICCSTAKALFDSPDRPTKPNNKAVRFEPFFNDQNEFIWISPKDLEKSIRQLHIDTHFPKTLQYLSKSKPGDSKHKIITELFHDYTNQNINLDGLKTKLKAELNSKITLPKGTLPGATAIKLSDHKHCHWPWSSTKAAQCVQKDLKKMASCKI